MIGPITDARWRLTVAARGEQFERALASGDGHHSPRLHVAPMAQVPAVEALGFEAVA